MIKILVNNTVKEIMAKSEVTSSSYKGFRVFRVNLNQVAFAAVLEDGTSAILLGNMYEKLSSEEKAFVFLHELGHIRAGHHKEAAYAEYEWDITHEYIADEHANRNMKNGVKAFCSAMETLAKEMKLKKDDLAVEDINNRYDHLIA